MIGVLKELTEKCVANASSVEICQLGDNRLLEETAKVFKKEKNMKKGKKKIFISKIFKTYIIK